MVAEPASPTSTAGSTCLERFELAAGDPAPGVLGALAEGDQPQEHLASSLSLLGVELRIQLVGASVQCAAQATELPIAGQGQSVVDTVVEQLGEHELEEGQHARLLGDLADQLGHQLGLDADSHSRRRVDRRCLEL